MQHGGEHRAGGPVHQTRVRDQVREDVKKKKKLRRRLQKKESVVLCNVYTNMSFLNWVGMSSDTAGNQIILDY